MKKNKIQKEKKIRRLLLINSDNEMQKKIRRKNPVLINSMTPLELENSFQLYKDRINTSVSTYTNVLEKHIVKQVVDFQKNINYYYSDFIEDKKGRMINHRYKGVYSAKNFGPNFGDLIVGEEESEENEEDEKEEKEEKEEELIKSIIPFINKKRSVGTGKIVKDKSYSLVSPGYNFKNKDYLNNICIDTCDCNSNDHHKCEKQKNRKKMLDMNYKLIYYCYTNLKRKRPLIIQNNIDNNVTINELYGLEIEEEYFNRMKMRGSTTCTVKKHKKRNKSNNDRLRPKSSKNVDGSIKKPKKNKHIKNNLKNNARECVTSKNRNNNLISNFTNVLNNLKSKVDRYITSDKKSIIKRSRLSQDSRFNKFRKNSIVKKHKKVNSNDNRIANVGESPFQNIISKLDTKTTSFDDNSSSLDNKNRNKNSKRKDINSNIHHHKEAAKNLKKDYNGRRKFKNITNSKLKEKYLEEMKVRDIYKPNKKSLKEPIRPQFMNSLQKKVGFNYEENKKNFYKNKPSSKLSLINKMKSKSKKDCTEYEDISDDDKLDYKNKMGLYNIKDKNINSFLLKKNYTLDRRRKFSYNEYK